jgi:hypothetical protein
MGIFRCLKGSLGEIVATVSFRLVVLIRSIESFQPFREMIFLSLSFEANKNVLSTHSSMKSENEKQMGAL